MPTNPVLVEMVRGSMVESFFRGAYVIADARGEIIDSVGDSRRPIYPRSALKLLQALAVLESGAGDAFHLSDEEIALSCSSHNGEERHVMLVNQWLKRLGFGCDVLACGIHAPLGKEAALTLVREGRSPTPAHNACSGKHAGFVTLALHLKVPVKSYAQMEHPVQQAVHRLVEDMTGVDIATAPQGIDGCQIPVIGMPLQNLAIAMAKIAQPQILGASLKSNAQKMIAAVQRHPDLLAGTKRFCTEIIKESNGQIIAKMGADGVFTAILPEKGWGIALKIDDGHLRAAEVALMGILKKHHLLTENPNWQRWLNPPIKNWNKEVVGEIRVPQDV